MKGPRLLLAFLLCSALSFALTNVNSCINITSPDTYVLTANLSGAPNPGPSGNACLVISASNVLLDCAGFTVTGSGNGIALNNTSNVTVQNCNLSGGFGNIRMVLQNADNGFFINNSAQSALFGFQLTLSDNNQFINNSAQSMEGGCYVLGSSNNNTFLNSNASGCSPGFSLTSSNNTLLTGIRQSGAGTGIFVTGSAPVSLQNARIFGNSVGVSIINSNLSMSGGQIFNDNSNDLQVSGTNNLLSLSNVVFDGNPGNFTNFSNVSLSDIYSGAYNINQASQPAALPSNRTSFRNKFLNITATSGVQSIDSLSLRWSEGELSGSEESAFELWKFNSSGWVLLNASPDTAANALSLSNHNPASTYAILEVPATLLSNCSLITSPGSYAMAGNFFGAPVDAFDVSLGASACIKIASPNVAFDCRGFSMITNETLFPAYGILLNASSGNVMVKNCPNVTNYTNAIYIFNSDNNTIRNVTSAGGDYGVVIESGDNNLVDSNRAFGGIGGFALDLFVTNVSSGNNFTNNLARNYSSSGFSINSPSILVNNTAVLGSFGTAGFAFFFSSGHTLTNNTALDGFYGFRFSFSDGNELRGNFARNNSANGFYAAGMPNFIVINNTAELNADTGYLFGQNTTAMNNSAISNSFGFDIGPDSLISGNSVLNGSGFSITGNTTVVNNTASGGNTGFIFFGSNITLVNNTAVNGGTGFFSSADSSGLFFINDRAINNSFTGFLLQFISNSTINGSAAINNSLHGFNFLAAQNMQISNSNATGNGGIGFATSTPGNFPVSSANFSLADIRSSGNAEAGLYLAGPNIAVVRARLFNNTQDIQVAGNGTSVTIAEAVLDNPLGNLQNYTNLSLNDSVIEGSISGTGYQVKWSAPPVSLPSSGFVSFNGKFINITNILFGENISIDSIVWRWQDSEVGALNESAFQLWRFNGTTWSQASGTPDTLSNRFALSNLNTFGVYGIFQNVSVALVQNLTVSKVSSTLLNASPGGIVAFNITVNNPGNASISPTVVDTFPAGLTFSSSSPVNSSGTGSTATWVLPSIAPGSVSTIMLNLSVGQGLVNASAPLANLTNSVSASAGNATSNASVNATVYYAAITAVKLDQTLAQPSPGGIAQFNITLTNTGNVTLNPVRVVDTLPSGLTFLSASPLETSLSGNNITWNNVGPLGSGASIVIRVNAMVNSMSPGQVFNLTNSVNVTGVPPNGANVTSAGSSSTLVYSANLSIVKSVISSGPYSVGGVVEYRINVTNTGNVTLNQIFVNDTLSPGLEFDSADMTPDSVSGSLRSMNWTSIGPISPGSSVIINLNATINASGNLNNSVSARGTPPNGNNATDADSVGVGIGVAGISAAKARFPSGPILVGNNVTYTATVTNTGSVPINISIIDRLPPGLGFLGANVTPGDVSGNNLTGTNITWSVTNAGPGSITLIAYNASVNSIGSFTNNLTALGMPANGQNASDSDSVTLSGVSSLTAPQDDDDQATQESLSIDITSTCGGPVFTVANRGSPVPGARVQVTEVTPDGSFVADVLDSNTNSSGQAGTSECGTLYRLRASKSGYSPAIETQTIGCANCAVSFECTHDSDCPQYPVAHWCDNVGIQGDCKTVDCQDGCSGNYHCASPSYKCSDWRNVREADDMEFCAGTGFAGVSSLWPVCTVSCLRDSDCPSSQYCEQSTVSSRYITNYWRGECRFDSCDEDSDCPSGLHCDSAINSCKNGCTTDSSCPLGFYCESQYNACVPGCRQGHSLNCGIGRYCDLDGQVCPGGSGCISGESEDVKLCVLGCDTDADCGKHERCNVAANQCEAFCGQRVEGRTESWECIPPGVFFEVVIGQAPPQCPNCPAGEACDNETFRCTVNCATDSDCEAGEFCALSGQAGVCRPRPNVTCTTDSECSGNAVCEGPSGNKECTDYQLAKITQPPHFFGNMTTVEARRIPGTGPVPCRLCDISLTDPSGDTISAQTDPTGKYTFQLQEYGNYTVKLLRGKQPPSLIVTTESAAAASFIDTLRQMGFCPPAAILALMAMFGFLHRRRQK